MARSTKKSGGQSQALSPAQFLKLVERGTLGPVYVFVGDDTEAMAHTWNAVRQACVPDEMEEFSLEVLHAESESVDAAQIIGAAETVPFMGSTRVVLVKHAEELTADDLGPLATYTETVCAEGRSGLLLILMCAALDRRTKFARAAAAAGCIVEFAAASVREVVATMQERYGKRVTAGALQLLEDYLENDTRSAYSELEKLSLYVGARDRITEADVLAVCVDSATRNEWELADRLVQGDCGAALEALRRMRQSGADTIYQYTIIATALARLPGAAEALRDGSLYKNWRTHRIGYNDPQRPAVERRLRALTPAAQAAGLAWLMYMDICLKGTALPGEVLCELMCLATTQPGVTTGLKE
jgi:DNA polymerase III delta subunit